MSAYTLNGNVVLVQREMADLVKGELEEGSYPTRRELEEWAEEEVSNLYVSDYELVKAMEMDPNTYLYARINDVSQEAQTILQVIEAIYRQELRDRVASWIEELWADVDLAEELDDGFNHWCDWCDTEARHGGPCPKCGQVMHELSPTRNIDLEQYHRLELGREEV